MTEENDEERATRFGMIAAKLLSRTPRFVRGEGSVFSASDSNSMQATGGTTA